MRRYISFFLSFILIFTFYSVPIYANPAIIVPALTEEYLKYVAIQDGIIFENEQQADEFVQDYYNELSEAERASVDAAALSSEFVEGLDNLLIDSPTDYARALVTSASALYTNAFKFYNFVRDKLDSGEAEIHSSSDSSVYDPSVYHPCVNYFIDFCTEQGVPFGDDSKLSPNNRNRIIEFVQNMYSYSYVHLYYVSSSDRYYFLGYNSSEVPKEKVYFASNDSLVLFLNSGASNIGGASGYLDFTYAELIKSWNISGSYLSDRLTILGQNLGLMSGNIVSQASGAVQQLLSDKLLIDEDQTEEQVLILGPEILSDGTYDYSNINGVNTVYKPSELGYVSDLEFNVSEDFLQGEEAIKIDNAETVSSLDTLWSWLTNFWDNLCDVFNDFYNSLLKGIRNIFANLFSYVKALVELVTDLPVKIFEQFPSLDKLWDWITGYWGKFWEYLMDFLDSLTSDFKSLLNWFGLTFIGDFNELKLSQEDLKLESSIILKFPFCIPFDMVKILKLFVVPEECPVIEIDLAPAFDNFNKYGLNLSDLCLVIDFGSDSRFVAIFRSLKYLIYFTFCVGLLRITRDIIRG